MKTNNLAVKRILAMALSVALVLTGTPVTALTAYAQDSGCNHVCGDGTCAYTEGADCTHVCGDGLCDYAEAVPCDHEHDENCAESCEHDCGDGSCAYAAGAKCNHAHGGGCGYIKAVPCDHQHNADCGGLSGQQFGTVIVSFATPAQTAMVALGTSRADLPLPETMEATLTDAAMPTDIPVEWTDEDGYDGDIPGDYDFTAAPLGYSLAEGVGAPVFTVTVLDEAGPVVIIGFDPNPYHQPDDPDATNILVDKGTAAADIPLPSSLAATIDGGAVNGYLVAVSEWVCEQRYDNETWQLVAGSYNPDEAGCYVFTPVLALNANESLAPGVTPPTVDVVVSMNMAIMPLAVAGAFDITGGTGYSYAANTLTITANGTYIIGMASAGATTTTDKIAVQSGLTAVNITLNGVSIDVSGTYQACAFDMGGATVNLTLQGVNTLKSGYDRAGIHVPTGANLTISGNGTANATGGNGGAGIGGDFSGNGGAVTINSGTVNAMGGPSGAGIGGGTGGNGGTVTISGGTVNATSSTGGHGAGISGGNGGSGGTVNISGGIVNATGENYGAGIGGAGSGSGANVTISGGTVRAVAGYGYPATPSIGRGGTSSGDNGSLAITGGSVYREGGSNSAEREAQAQNSGMNVYRVRLDGLPAGVTITAASGNSVNYGIKDVFPDGGGYYYFWALAGSTSISVTADGIVYMASVNVLTDNSASATLSQIIPVSAITGIPTIMPMGTLTLNPTVEPSNATNKTIAWSIEDAGTTSASLSGNVLSASTPGTLALKATIANGTSAGTDFTQVFNITVDAATQIGAFSILGGTGYTYTANTLTITANGTYIIGMASAGATTTTDKIAVQSGLTAVNITLNGVSIDVSAIENCAFDMGGATVNLTLTGDNTLKSGDTRAGISVPAGANLTVSGSGTVNATGKGGGAGIGGGFNGNAGTITIAGGTVNANGGTGGMGAAGIGGGQGGSGGTVTISGGMVNATGLGAGTGIGGANAGVGANVTISGGTVRAQGGNMGASIGSGSTNTANNHGTLTITGGSVYRSGSQSAREAQAKNSDDTNIYRVRLDGLPTGATITATAINGTDYGINDVFPDENGYYYYFWLPAGSSSISVTADGVNYVASPNVLTDNSISATLIEDTDPPAALSAGSVNRTSDTEATIGFTTSKAGTAYYLVLASGATAPASTAVKAGTSLRAVAEGAASGKTVALTAGARDIYVVVEDAAGKISEPLKIEAAAYIPEEIFVNGAEVTPLTVANIQAAIANALDVNAIVTVTGRFTGATSTLTLLIPAGKIVVWQAEYSGSSTGPLVYVFYIGSSGNMEITASGVIHNANDIAINIGSNATLTVNGGAVKAGNADAIHAEDYATVFINSGTVENNSSGNRTIGLVGNSVLAVHGGTMRNNTTAENVVWTGDNSVVYVTGGTIANDGIVRQNGNDGGTGTAYYTGAENAAKFKTSIAGFLHFVADYDLFRLDNYAPALSIEDGSTYTYSSATPHEGSVTAKFPTGLALKSVTANPTAAAHTFSGNTVTFEGTYDEPTITLDITGTLANGKIPVSFTTASFGVNIATLGDPQTIAFATQDKGTVNAVYGDSLTRAATVSVGNTTGTVTYVSSDQTVATVAAGGAVTILKPGTTRITATIAAVTGEWAETSTFYDLTVSAKSLTVTAGNYTVTKEYDGTTNAGTGGGSLVTGILSTDSGTVTVTATPEAYGSKDVGSSYTVTVDLTLNNVDGKYTLSNSTVDVSGSITRKSVTITGVTADNKVYDGNTTATVSGSATLSANYDGGNLIINTASASATFADKNVGDGISVTFSGYSLSGSAAGNYTLSAQPASVTANITAKSVTITGVSATNREYDGTTTVNITGGTLVGVEQGDAVNPDVPTTGTVATADAGNGKPVTIGNITLSGADAANYTLTQPTGITVNITEKLIGGVVTISVNHTGGSDPNKIDEGDTLTADVSGVTPSGATLSYQWYRNRSAIPGEINQTYTVQDVGTDPVGTLISVLVSGTVNYTGNVTSDAAEVGKIPLGGSISIDASGTAFGDTLTLDTTSLTPAGAAYDIKWLRDGTAIPGATGVSYTITKSDQGKTIIVEITGKDDYTGTMSDSVNIPAVVPEAPQNLTATPGNGQVSLSWSTPAFDGGSVVTKYKVSSDNGASWTDAGPNTSYVFTGLANGTSYSFKVRAVNSAGNGAEASASATPQSPSTVPTAPQNLTATTGNGQVTLSWTAPASNGGSVITGYQVSKDNGSTWVAAASNTSHNFTGLTNGTTYTFKVRAVNSVGSGAEASVAATSGSSGNGGSSGGGGGGSSSSSSTTTTPVTTEKQPNMPTVAKVSVTGKVKDKVMTVNIITEKMAKDAIAAVRDTGNGIAVQFIVTGSGDYASLSATFERAALEALKTAGVKYVQFGSNIIDLTLDTKTITGILAQTTGNITVTATRQTKLSDAAKALIGSRPVFDITIKDGKGVTVSDLKGGTATIGIPYKPASWEKTGNLYGVYVDGNGKPQLLTSSSYDNGKVIFARGSLSIYGVGYKTPAPAYTDTTNHWAKDNIDFVASRDLISGTSATTFSPDTAITRADFLMALGKLSGADVSGYTTSSFTDVANTSAAMPYIEWAVKNKIVQGIGNNKFGPDNKITREDLAVMMVNYAKATGNTLPVSRQYAAFADDAKISAYAKDAVKAIQQTGVTNGKTGNLFDPKGNATRAEASTILRRFVELVIDEGTARGWVQNDAGQWQYINTNGKAVTGWLNTDANKYWFDDKGVMVSGKWVQIGGKWYYFYADGKLAVNTTVEGYEIGADGARK